MQQFQLGLALRRDSFMDTNLMTITPDDSLVSEYLYYTLIHIELWRIADTTSIPQINNKHITPLVIPLPSTKAEQQAIAEALSDADALIESLEQVIAKKRNLKQGAMQELLTGNRRLDGFHKKWNVVRLGDLFSFKNGLNKAKEFFGHGTPIVNYMDVFKRPYIYASDLGGRVSLSRDEMNNYEVRNGDVFFTRTSETTEEIGIASVVLDAPVDTVFSGFILRGRPKNDRLLNEFKAYCFSSKEVRKQIISKASYTTRALTNGRILSQISLSFPGHKEQEAIASALFDMDAEIDALEIKLTKANQIKQGMMQELLTGRIRFV